MKQINKSKRQLAQLLIEAGVTQFQKGVNWAAQDGNVAGFYSGGKPYWDSKYHEWASNAEDGACIGVQILKGVVKNHHQTVLSRDEFDQIVAETVMTDELVADGVIKRGCDGRIVTGYSNGKPITRIMLEPLTTTTLDQLLQDWRNADDYAQRKQTEADEAAAMREERWQAVQARAGEIGVAVGRCYQAVATELVVTGWRDVRCGDYVWVGDSGSGHKCPSGEYEVVEIDAHDTKQPFGVKWNDRVTWPQIHERGWRFIRRP